MCVMLLIVFGLTSYHSIHAAEVQQVESEGSIGFTGRYESIGSPDPPPSSTKSQVTMDFLPQTNMVDGTRTVYRGIILLVLLIFIMVSKAKKKVGLK